MTNIQCALALAEEYGKPVFPCKLDKSPYTEHGFKDATCNLEQISQDWDRWPDALVGLPTGASSGILVVDIDPLGLTWYMEHQADLLCGLVQYTRRDGYHLYYRMPDVDIRNSASDIAPGVDVRAEGGYVISWDCEGLQRTGGLEDLTDPPPWLLALLTKPAVAKPAEKLNGSGIPEGSRNQTLTSFAGTLRRAGLGQGDIEIALGIKNAHCSPPLSGGELYNIAKSIMRYAPAPVDAPAPKNEPIDWSLLSTQTPPERQWAIDHWLGMGHVTLLSGGGGMGKTLLAQAMASCIVLRRDYLDWMPAERRVLMWATEDDRDELARRQIALARWLGVPLSDFAGRFVCHSYDGEQVELAGLVQQKLVGTAMLTQLREQIGDYRADYVFLDNIARLFAGNENDRHQVTSFIAMLTAAGAATHAGITLLGHPGKAMGSEYSGSTAWEGAVRSRLYLGRTLPDSEAIEAEADDGMRYLSRRKANYTARDWRRLRFHEGVLVPDAPVPTARRNGTEFARDVVRRAVLKLATLGDYGVAATNSPNYLPKLAANMNLMEELSEREFVKAMTAMRLDLTLVLAPVGKYVNRTKRQGLVLAEGT